MRISKKAEYAIIAVIYIAKQCRSEPIPISELSSQNSIPTKFLEQILINLKNSGILMSKRGAHGGYLLGLLDSQITVGMILNAIDGSFDPIGIKSGNKLAPGLYKCFDDLNQIVTDHLNKFSIKDIITRDDKSKLYFEI